MTDEDTVSWRVLRAEARDALGAAGMGSADQEAWWLVEEASGLDRTALVTALDDAVTVGGVARLDAMLARRCEGEPIQYVLGHWPFRALDLLVDRRVLIPRPETEQVVTVALEVLDRVWAQRPDGHRPAVVDLGTGSGAIALSVACERPGARVYGTDRSADALAVARANLAGLGMAGSAVHLSEGSWFDALPAELSGSLDVVVANPPYIATTETIARSVTDWEPAEALFSGPSGLEAFEELFAGAARWLAPGGAIVVEIGAGQADDVVALAAAAGFDDLQIETDLAGLDRTFVASWS